MTVEDHLNAFLKFIDDLEVEHEDAVMKMFLQTLKGEARAWYKALLGNSIHGWDSFRQSSQVNGRTNRTTLSFWMHLHPSIKMKTRLYLNLVLASLSIIIKFLIMLGLT